MRFFNTVALLSLVCLAQLPVSAEPTTLQPELPGIYRSDKNNSSAYGLASYFKGTYENGQSCFIMIRAISHYSVNNVQYTDIIADIGYGNKRNDIKLHHPIKNGAKVEDHIIGSGSYGMYKLDVKLNRPYGSPVAYVLYDSFKPPKVCRLTSSVQVDGQ